ncbi:MAG: RluA family pseudouridine synthase [Salinivirgaceae bacterium]|nr:RluA family pseudouridine synthase [Salinivirgaceae bacterium]MDD4746702.1 RluA family pseudouridine synthase [Salinivirgaceae bacterium]MDY0281897.1 RluA family pseudouridine synthase [Salinivirgaceae bacterium]
MANQIFKLQVLYEDNHIIAVNKPAGVPVQGDSSGDMPLLDIVMDYIKVKYNKPGKVYLGLVHRVDRPVSGVVLFAKTSKALVRLNEMFQNRQVKKTYWAVVGNQPEELSGTLENYLLKDTVKNKSHASNKSGKGAKKATLYYELIGRSNKYCLLHVDLQTGRHHQIRCQLAKIGCPIRGDLKYGAPRSNPDAGINLHSLKVEFEHPVTKLPISIMAPLPANDNLWNEFKNLIE